MMVVLWIMIAVILWLFGVRWNMIDHEEAGVAALLLLIAWPLMLSLVLFFGGIGAIFAGAERLWHWYAPQSDRNRPVE